MKRIVVLCVLWLACLRLIPETNSLVAHPRLNRTITGKVFDGETKTPVFATLLVSIGGLNTIEAKSDSLGQFSMTIPEATKCIIQVHAQGFEAEEETIEISESAASYLEIALTPIVKLTLEGTVYGGLKGNEKPLDATMTVYINSDFIKEDSIAVLNGRYKESFTNFGWYIIDFSAPGYAAATDTIWVMNTSRKTIHKDYHLVPLDSKIPTVLSDIQFDFNQSKLNPNSFTELNYLAQFLKHNPTKQIEITGHADGAGSKEYNLAISELRATTVANYLMSRGVSADQLVSTAFGAERPIDTNSTSNGRARNRRVELVVTDKTFSVVSTETDFGRIHFDFGKTILNPSYYSELDQVAEFIKKDSNVHYEIVGHSDSTGPSDYNVLLSTARAQTVFNYLLERGISRERLICKGYGDKKPIASNATSEGKANNRRVEIVPLIDSAPILSHNK